VLTHPWDVFVRRWNWKAAVLSAVFRGVAFALPMSHLAGHDILRTVCLEVAFRLAIGGFWGSLLQAFRGAQPAWLATTVVAVVLPAVAHSIEFVVLRAGHTTHLLTAMIVSVGITVGSLVINFGLMRRGLLLTGRESQSLGADLRQIPGALAGMFRLSSRRAFMGVLAGGLLARVKAATQSQRTDRVLERTYRADAQILLLGITILRREGVGGGSVLWREADSGGADRLLEFTGYSTPERAAGLNRFGFIREQARPAENGCRECVYFGLMTASPEESAEEARKALHSSAKEQTYTAIDGKIRAGATETATAHFTAPATLSGEHRTELVDRARRALAAGGKTTASPVTAGESQSFLQALADLLLRPDGVRTGYSYAGRTYELRLARSIDRKATTYYREKSLIAAPTDVLRVAGKIRRVIGGKEIDFRLWIPASTDRPLPLRIEYQPKSYLRLVFEA
jgi:hypothetical protein